MLLVLCVDLDDDLGRKTDVETPVIGRDNVVDAAVALASADPEDSDVNVLFEGVHIADGIDDEAVEVAAVTGVDKGDVAANRAVGEEVDKVLASLASDEDVRALVVTDGAQDESVVPVIRSRIRIDGVRRVVVRQAQDLESMYYTMKQVLNDPETRGTVLVPLGVLLLIYPLAILSDWLGLPGAVLGVTSGLLGLYVLFRGLGLGEPARESLSSVRESLYAGRVTLVTYVDRGGRGVRTAAGGSGKRGGPGPARRARDVHLRRRPVGRRRGSRLQPGTDRRRLPDRGVRVAVPQRAVLRAGDHGRPPCCERVLRG
jgi:putative membrane protein